MGFKKWVIVTKNIFYTEEWSVEDILRNADGMELSENDIYELEVRIKIHFEDHSERNEIIANIIRDYWKSKDDTDYYRISEEAIKDYLEENNLMPYFTSKDMIDEASHKYYKNYYYYEMDKEFALKAAVSEVLVDNKIEAEGFEIWIP